MDTVKDANLFLDGKIGHTVTTSKFNPARGIHNVQVDVKRSGIIGGVAKLFGAVAGTYRMNIEVLKDPYETLLKIGVDKTEILNRDALLQYAEKLKGEDKQDFIDVLKGSPVVKMGSHTSFGTYVERYVIVPNNHPLFPRNEIFGKGLSQVMKDAGPTVAAP